MLSTPPPHSRPIRVGVVLPAHDEARHIGAVIAGIPAWVDSIYVVDDASTDGTAAAAWGQEDDRVMLIEHAVNTGVGGAMRTGYEAALLDDCDIVVKMDADGQMESTELPILLRPLLIGAADYVKGNRFRSTGRPQGMPFARWFGNVVLSFLTKMASGYWHVFDPQCGFTAITAPTLARLRLDALAQDYFFENDMLIRLNVIDARVVEVSTAALYADEDSGLRIGRVLWLFPVRLARGFVWRFVRRHLVNDFGPIAMLSLVGAVLAVFGIAFGIYHWVESAITDLPATAGTVMIAVLPIILGVQMLLQALVLEVQSSSGADETRTLSRPSLGGEDGPLS